MLVEKELEKMLEKCISDRITSIKVEGVSRIFFFTFNESEIEKIKEMLKALPIKKEFSLMEIATCLKLSTNVDMRNGISICPNFSRAEEIMALGIAIGKFKYVYPRKNWYTLPFGLPILEIIE